MCTIVIVIVVLHTYLVLHNLPLLFVVGGNDDVAVSAIFPHTSRHNSHISRHFELQLQENPAHVTASFSAAARGQPKSPSPSPPPAATATHAPS